MCTIQLSLVSGPMAHLFHNVHEQNYVAHVMAYAARIGPYIQEMSHGIAGTISTVAVSGNLIILLLLLTRLVPYLL